MKSHNVAASLFSLTPKLKLLWLTRILRLLSVAYIAWATVRVFSWWLDGTRVVVNFGRYVERDISGAHEIQRIQALALDCIELALLIAALVFAWKAMSLLNEEHQFSTHASSYLARCGWLITMCQTFSLMMRPIKTFLMTAHLPVAEQVFKWSFMPTDLLATLLCAVVLCFAYMMHWAAEVAEENRGFV